MAMLVPVCAGLLRRFSWLNQRLIDDQPALPTPWTWVQFQSRFEVLGFEMRSSSRDSGHVILLEPVQPFCFLILSYFSLRSQLGSRCDCPGKRAFSPCKHTIPYGMI